VFEKAAFFNNTGDSSVSFTLHLQHHTDPATERKLDWIMKALRNIIEGQQNMARDFTKLEAELSENSSAIDSAVALITAVAQEIRDAAGDQARINDIADKLDAQSQRLAEAVVANQAPAPAAPAA
jgi:hypothetical protein